MIKYNIICAHNHEFEVWFSKSSDFDDQAPKGLIGCPDCGNTRVEKAIMAPAVNTARAKAARKESHSKSNAKLIAMMKTAAQNVRKEIAKNCEDVGDSFVNEARAIHYGEKPERSIYGRASAKDASRLREEGVGISPLPDALVPIKKNDLN